MNRFLRKSELTERRAFIETFVKEIELLPDNAVVRYTIPHFSIDTKKLSYSWAVDLKSSR